MSLYFLVLFLFYINNKNCLLRHSEIIICYCKIFNMSLLLFIGWKLSRVFFCFILIVIYMIELYISAIYFPRSCLIIYVLAVNTISGKRRRIQFI